MPNFSRISKGKKHSDPALRNKSRAAKQILIFLSLHPIDRPIDLRSMSYTQAPSPGRLYLCCWGMRLLWDLLLLSCALQASALFGWSHSDQLRAAASKGDAAKALRLLKRGAEVNAGDWVRRPQRPLSPLLTRARAVLARRVRGRRCTLLLATANLRSPRCCWSAG
jgi:hypothetical protein